jgi:ubiquinone/menaquinone biosynthesis C-methylase UbiE
LQRARARLPQGRVRFAIADLTRLPYARAAFDAIVCGWALEHLPDPTPGLSELARVLEPGGKLLLLCTEDTLTGAICSRTYHCRTYNRDELRRTCTACGLIWHRELWFTGLHRLVKLGGIIVELRRAASSLS